MPTGYAFLSGAFGAIASCFAKVAFSDDTFLTRWLLQTCETVTSSGTSNLLTDDHCLPLSYAVRGLCFVGTLALNIFMVGSFLAGMEESGSLAGTAISNGANFVVSSLFGFLLWGENFSINWLLGFLLVIAGTMVLSTVKAGEGRNGEERDLSKDKREKTD